ncbi:MAG: hypothetical protein Q4F84_02290 [Fibrobacter sp.]|nr:hypothetical protein [Fibrobacter sp.]
MSGKLLCFLLLFSFSDVLDNTSGGITDGLVKVMCDSISNMIEKSNRYYVYKREFIEPVLVEQKFETSNMVWSQADGLTAAGNLLSVDQVIGGSVSRDGNMLSLKLERISVADKTILASVYILSKATKRELFSTILPGKVDELLINTKPMFSSTENQDISPQTTIKSKGKFPIWTCLTTLIVAGAAAGTYFALENDDKKSEKELSVYPLPSRE